MKMNNITRRAILETITDIGQLSDSELKELNHFVKKGFLKKTKAGCFPTLKTVYSLPSVDTLKIRQDYINNLFAFMKVYEPQNIKHTKPTA